MKTTTTTAKRPKRARRERLASGIYRDRYGISIIVGSGPRREEHRFPLTIDLRELKAKRLHLQGDYADAAPVPLRKGTLAADVPRFLDVVDGAGKRYDFARHLRVWLAAPFRESGETFSDQRRDAIARLDVKAQITRWLEAGAAPGTVNHRVRSLRALYVALDGEDAPTPTDKIHKVTMPKPESRGLPIPLVDFVLAQIRDRIGASGRAHGGKILLRIMATTGMPQMQIERLRDMDIDLPRARYYARPRRKGKGSDGRWVGLIPPGVEALQAFVDAGLVGRHFTRRWLAVTLRKAIQRATREAFRLAQAGDRAKLELVRLIPANCRPYDFRHSFLTEVYRVSKDLQAVAHKGQHASLETARRYMLGAVTEADSQITHDMAAVWGKPMLPAIPLRMAKADLKQPDARDAAAV